MQTDPFKSLSLDTTSVALLRRLYRDHFRNERRNIVAAILCMLTFAATTVAFAKMIEPVLNRVFLDRSEAMILPLAVAVLLIMTLRGVATYGQRFYLVSATVGIVRRMQQMLFDRLMRADFVLFQSASAGEMIGRTTSDAELMGATLVETMIGSVRDLLTLVGLVGLMVYQDWLLALAAFVTFPFAARIIRSISRRTRNLTRRRQAANASLITGLDEAFRGIRYVKAYRMEGHESARIGDWLGQLRTMTVQQARIAAAAYPLIGLLAGLAVAAVIAYGGYQVINGVRTAGELMSFVAAMALCFEPIKRLSQVSAQIQKGLAATERVFAVLDNTPFIVDRETARPIAIAGGEIRFEDVDFAYGRGPAALTGLSLVVPAGRTVALVGPSGAGKSTVLNLIPRFYDVGGGRVAIDGQDVRDVTIDSLRRSIALVSQELSLFDDTIRANIAYGRPGVDDEAVVAAARHAGAHDFIATLPDGYETRVGGRGERLSGGQRQRIAIARAMLRDAPILLLDEPTSALDADTERQVQAALRELARGRTTLIVAHRLSTIMTADLIYVLDGGRLVEHGTHAELLARGGRYAALYREAADAAPAATADRRMQAG